MSGKRNKKRVVEVKSQKELIREYLKKGKRITPLETLKKFGCFRLGARIYELKKEMDIHSRLVTKNGKRFSEYWIEL